MMIWIDTHTHLNVKEFDTDRGQVIEKSIQEGVVKMLLPNIDVSHINSMYETKSLSIDSIELMMGLHPCSVNTDYEKELDVIKEELYTRPFVGVGEIGLDLYWDKSTYEIQRDAFMKQLTWSNELGLPVSIHSREATQECIDCIKELNKDIKGVFHCFSGSVEQAYDIIDLNMYLGIGGVVSYKKTNLPDIIKAVGINKLVLETDSPYLSPAPFRGKRNESSYLNIIGTTISEILSLSVEKVAESTTENACMIFKLKL